MRALTRSLAAAALAAAVVTVPLASTAHAADAGAAGPAVADGGAAVTGRGYTNCGYDYNWCMSLRRAMLNDGYRLGPLMYYPPDCTAPGGCYGGYQFYYYW